MLCHCTPDVQGVQLRPICKLRTKSLAMEKPSLPQACFFPTSDEIHILRRDHLKYWNAQTRPAPKIPHTLSSLGLLHPSLQKGIGEFGIPGHSAWSLQHRILVHPQVHPLNRGCLIAMTMEGQSALEQGIPILPMYQSCQIRHSGTVASGIPDNLVWERHQSPLNQAPSNIPEKHRDCSSTLTTRCHISTPRKDKDNVSTPRD